jgi:hypothetical protein
MTPATLALIAEVIQMLMSAAASMPSVIAAGETAIGLLKTNTDPTAEQETAIRAAMDAANDLLQGA